MTTGVRSLAYSSAMQVEHRITVAASPDAIFRIYADVGQWSFQSWRALVNGDPVDPHDRRINRLHSNVQTDRSALAC